MREQQQHSLNIHVLMPPVAVLWLSSAKSSLSAAEPTHGQLPASAALVCWEGGKGKCTGEWSLSCCACSTGCLVDAIEWRVFLHKLKKGCAGWLFCTGPWRVCVLGLSHVHALLCC